MRKLNLTGPGDSFICLLRLLDASRWGTWRNICRFGYDHLYTCRPFQEGVIHHVAHNSCVRRACDTI
jgi:hypothetical protein